MIIVYSSPNCPGCEAVKKQLTEKNIDFKVMDISADLEAKSELIEAGYRSVPQLFDTELCSFVTKDYLGL